MKRPQPSALIFAIGLFAVSLMWMAYGERTVLDDRGISFTVPDGWPKDLPLPKVKSNCVRCHIDKGGAISEAVIDYAAGTHDRDDISCHDCHGGLLEDDEKAHDIDFVSGHTALMNKCIDCHRAQSRVFRRSPHFSETKRWDLPTCSNCHDNHSVGKGDFRMANACTQCHGSVARAVTGIGESQIIWKSRSAGSHGNSIAVTMLAEGKNRALSVEHDLGGPIKELVVHLATDEAGQPTSLAMDVIDAIAMDKQLYYTISSEEGDDALGEDRVKPAGRFMLQGGSDFGDKYPAYREIIEANDTLWGSLALLKRHDWPITDPWRFQLIEVAEPIMKLIHGVPAEPEAAHVDYLARSSLKLKEEIDEFLATLE